MKKTFFLFALLSILISCNNKQKNADIKNQSADMQVGVAKEVLQTNDYTYLRLSDKKTEQWVAVPKMKAERGKTYYYTGGLEMTNFHSKELNRDFPSVLFLDKVMDAPAESGSPADLSQPHGNITTPKEDIQITKDEGIVSLKTLFSNPSSYDGKMIKVKGKVTKFNAAIMNRNWIHIQDGTEYEGNFELVVTSDQTVNTGDVVTLEGKIALHKDFGYGYVYDVLLEDATLLK